MIITFTTYSYLFGTPWGKHAFSNQVTKYMVSKYPDVKVIGQSVQYEFKQMRYSSTLTTEEIEFHVRVNNNGTLEDDYYLSTLNTKLTKVLTSLVKNVDQEGNARFIIEETNNDDKAILQSELTPVLQAHSKIFIYLSKDITNDENGLQTCYKILEGIKSKKIDGNIVFFFQKLPKVFIGYKQMQEIYTAEDIKKYLKN
ncbi:hypothetical protein [Paenibacillus chitinolyticus]|uniref:hypothetical protein n=1 Tax=Paenibacillus chitinolyticus TaxID=79263 RepID=UPI003D09136F